MSDYPIVLAESRARLFDQRVHRDEDDDDCMYYDPVVKKCHPCMGDGHYMCDECASFNEWEYTLSGAHVFIKKATP